MRRSLSNAVTADADATIELHWMDHRRSGRFVQHGMPQLILLGERHARGHEWRQVRVCAVVDWVHVQRILIRDRQRIPGLLQRGLLREERLRFRQLCRVLQLVAAFVLLRWGTAVPDPERRQDSIAVAAPHTTSFVFAITVTNAAHYKLSNPRAFDPRSYARSIARSIARSDASANARSDASADDVADNASSNAVADDAAAYDDAGSHTDAWLDRQQRRGVMRRRVRLVVRSAGHGAHRDRCGVPTRQRRAERTIACEGTGLHQLRRGD